MATRCSSVPAVLFYWVETALAQAHPKADGVLGYSIECGLVTIAP